ncbi:MAG: molybdopterin-binding protein [Spirochaetales bacterium]|nr:molybdopterin-binding protein [Spirochaetales bacterium]
MKKIAVEEAVGTVLAHDLTRIVRGESKGPAFRKGHIVQEADLPLLRDMGKNHLFVLELGDHSLHENEGALFLAELFQGPNVELTSPAEGKVNSLSACEGRLEVNIDLLKSVNSRQGIITATRHSDSVVKKGDILGGTKIIPLTIAKDILEQVKESCASFSEPLFQVKPFLPLRVGLVVTGSEVFYGRIKDTFSDVIEEKIHFYGGQVVKKVFAPDEETALKEKGAEILQDDLDLLIFTGGMSVDPDDLTPSVISDLSTEVITYGSPVLPGAMFMMAYRDGLPLIGVPACGMFHKTTVLDLVLPRLFTKDRISRDFILSKAHGGLCLNCPECIYPHCPFGK